MKIETSREWFQSRAPDEEGQEIGAGATELRGCDPVMESAVRLMVATLARGGCSHHMPEIAAKLGLSSVHVTRMAALFTECADALHLSVGAPTSSCWRVRSVNAAEISEARLARISELERQVSELEDRVEDLGNELTEANARE